MFNFALPRQLNYIVVCVPCMSSAHPLVSFRKNSKIQIFFSNEMGDFFPEGASPLHAQVTLGSVSKSQGG